MNTKNSRRVLYGLLTITLLCFIPLRHLRFEFNIEKFFPANDPDLRFFQQFQKQFHSEIDDEFILIGLKNNDGIFRQNFLYDVDSLSKFISHQENIIKVYSLTSSTVIYFRDSQVHARPLIQIEKPSLYARDSAYLFQSPEYRNLLISNDGKSVAIAAFNQRFLSDPQKDTLLNRIRKQIDLLGFDEAHLTAKIYVERVYVNEIERNLVGYLLLALLLIGLCLYLLFRSVKAIVMPLAIIVVSITWTMALIALTGHSLDIISSLLPPILAAICMSDIIHLSTAYIEELRTGISKQKALSKAFREVGLATFYTCCTVAIGFLTLAITNIIPIRNFGIFAATGILMAFVISLSSLYAFYQLGPVPTIAKRPGTENWWNRKIAALFITVIRNKIKILLTLVVLTVISLFGISKIEINSSLLQEIPRHHPILDDYKFIEKDFAGTRPFEMALTASNPSEHFLQVDMMKQVEEIEQFLHDSLNIGFIISPLSLFRAANKSYSGGKVEKFKLPSNSDEVIRLQDAIMQTEFADEMQNYLTADAKVLRISGRLPDLPLKKFEVLRKRLNDFINKKNYAASFHYHLTGSGVLVDNITYSLTSNLFFGIAIDAIIISLITVLLLRNWRVVIIVLIPNVIPLLVMGGVMGYMGVNLKSDTSLIFAIAFAIAVDDTIHFLSRIRLELSRGLSLTYAVKRTYLSTGKAIVITALVLITGFATLLSSSFGGAFYIGLLISICLLAAVIMDLTVLPVLLLLFGPGKTGKRK